VEKTISFSEQELNILKQLIHFAVQARGLEVAEASVVLVKKLDAQPEKPANGGTS
jgi:hypothetical protein